MDPDNRLAVLELCDRIAARVDLETAWMLIQVECMEVYGRSFLSIAT